jgi:tetratricopeptide (TPR) repeat protein
MGIKRKISMKRLTIGCLYICLPVFLMAVLLWPMRGMAAPSWQTGATEETPSLDQLVKIGDDYAAKSQYDKAVQAYQEAIPLALALESDRTLANILRKMGRAYRQQQQYEQSLDAYQQAAELWRKLGDGDRQVRALVPVGANYALLKQYPDALQTYSEALRITRALQDNALTADILLEVGSIHEDMGEHEQAIATFEQALAAAEQAGDQLLTATILNAMGALYRRQRSYAMSTEHYQQAAQLWRTLGKAQREVLTLEIIGLNAVAQGQPAEAIKYFQQALALAPGDSDVEAKILTDIGKVQANSKQYEQARDAYLQALDLWQQLNNTANVSSVRNALWKIYVTTGQHAEALAIADTSVGISAPLSGSVVSNLVTISGLAQHPELRKWQLDLLLNGDTEQATHLDVSRRPQWGELFTFDSTKYPNGQHQLRLRVVRQDTNYDEYFTTIVIRN